MKKYSKTNIYSYISKQKYKKPNKTCKVNQYYIDVVIDGSLKFGKSFAKKFNTSIEKNILKIQEKNYIKKRFKFKKKFNTKKIDKLIKQINLHKNLL